MAEQKQYVPKCGVKTVTFQDGGEMFKLNFHAETLINFVKANTNEKGYITFGMTERREPSQYGDTHSLWLDTWKPKEGGQRSAPRANSTPANQPPPIDNGEDSVPF